MISGSNGKQVESNCKYLSEELDRSKGVIKALREESAESQKLRHEKTTLEDRVALLQTEKSDLQEVVARHEGQNNEYKSQLEENRKLTTLPQRTIYLGESSHFLNFDVGSAGDE